MKHDEMKRRIDEKMLRDLYRLRCNQAARSNKVLQIYLNISISVSDLFKLGTINSFITSHSKMRF